MAKVIKSKETLQTFFIWSVAVAFFGQVAQTVYFMQLNNNAEYSLWSWFFGVGIVLALWLVLFLSRSKPNFGTQTLFDVTLLTTATLLLSYSIGWLVTSFIPLNVQSDPSSFVIMTTALYQGLPLLLVAPIVFMIVRRLRTTKQW